MNARRLLMNARGASAVEFALVLPLFLFLFFGVIDMGRWIWTYNRAEKATQMGARYAVVTNYVAPGLGTSYIGTGGLTQGDAIPAAAFGKISCSNTACTCATTPCPSVGALDTTQFGRIVARMQAFAREIRPTDVTVEYSTSGFGYAGNPNGPDLAPIVTVSLTNMRFTPMICAFFRCSVRMPNMHTSLTFEDAKGMQSN